MTLRHCLDCQILTRSTTSRCGPCQRNREKTRNAARKDLYGGTWYATSRRARKNQPWCSVCGAETQLTLDHERWQVECRSCNSSHRRNAR